MTTEETKTEDLLKLMESQRRISDKLSLLYPVMLTKKPTVVTARELAKEGLKFDVWPLLEQVEANIQLRAHDARSWMNDSDQKGIRHAYKTEKRGRRPFHECQQEELRFDIWQKVEMGQDTRDRLRSDITNYKLVFKETPTGPNGEKLPSWIWSEEDDKMFNLIEGRTSDSVLPGVSHER